MSSTIINSDRSFNHDPRQAKGFHPAVVPLLSCLPRWYLPYAPRFSTFFTPDMAKSIFSIFTSAKSLFFTPSLAKRGRGDLLFLQNVPYPLQNPLQVLQHISIGKPEDLYPHIPQPGIACAVLCEAGLDVMLSPVEFYHKQCCRTIKVNNISCDNLLSVELATLQLLPSQL